MTALCEDAIDTGLRLPPGTQDDLARFLLELASEEPLHPDEIAALDEAGAEIASGERASPRSVRRFWRFMMSGAIGCAST